jgi:hypothetical protein
MSVAVFLYGLDRPFKGYDNILQHVIKPLEQGGEKVDVFVHRVVQQQRGQAANNYIQNIAKTFTERSTDINDKLKISEFFPPRRQTKPQDYEYIQAMYSKQQCYRLAENSSFSFAIFVQHGTDFISDLTPDILYKSTSAENTIGVTNDITKDTIFITKKSLAGEVSDTFTSIKQDSKSFDAYDNNYTFLRLSVVKKINTYLIHSLVAGGVTSEQVLYEQDYIDYRKSLCLFYIILGNYESKLLMLDRRRAETNATIVLFTDDKKVVRECEKFYVMTVYVETTGRCSKKVQRSIKTNPHERLPKGYQWSLYMDGNIILDSFEKMIKLGYKHRKHNLVCFKHPDRTEPFSEAIAVLELGWETQQNIDTILDEIRDKNITVDHLTNTSVLYRRLGVELEFGKDWERCVNICIRDQISFDYLLEAYNVDFVQLPVSDRNFVTYIRHTGDLSRKRVVVE